jgi:hypothetical protein
MYKFFIGFYIYPLMFFLCFQIGKEKIVFKIVKIMKKDIMCARTINVSVGEN